MKSTVIAVFAVSILVAVSATAQAPRFNRETPRAGQPVVVDSRTGLMWQGCARGQSGDTCGGTSAASGWQAAVSYCEGLDWAGHTDWRLPSSDELRGIVDRNHEKPAIDTAVFPGTESRWFWTSSVYTSNPAIAWGVFFHNGSASLVDRKIQFLARCVRGK